VGPKYRIGEFMLVGIRCDEMLKNRLQCPSPAEEGSAYCRVHNLLKKSADVTAARAKELAAQSEVS
jgi:hypothetical protein